MIVVEEDSAVAEFVLFLWVDSCYALENGDYHVLKGLSLAEHLVEATQHHKTVVLLGQVLIGALIEADGGRHNQRVHD